MLPAKALDGRVDFTPTLHMPLPARQSARAEAYAVAVFNLKVHLQVYRNEG